LSDYTVGETHYFLFTTRAFATGIPTVLTSGVISAYENEGLTQITAGVTLGADHDAVVGLNLGTVAATGGNGFEAGKDYHLVITVGTVGGVSVVGEVVGRFTLQASAAFTRLGAPAGASVSADLLVIDNFVDGLETTIGAAGAGLTAVAWNPAWDAEVQSEVADALAVYDPPTNAEMELRTLVAAGYASPTNITAGVITTVTYLTNAPTAGDLTATMKASVNTEADTAITDAALATAANLALVDTVVDAIQVKTDQMVFTKANEIDSNVQSINGVTITGDGSVTPFDV